MEQQPVSPLDHSTAQKPKKAWLIPAAVGTVLAVLLLFAFAHSWFKVTGHAGIKEQKFTWLILNNVNYSYATTVDINGSHYDSFDADSGSGIASKPIPFKDGENQIKIGFTPRPKQGHRRVNLKVILASKMMPDADSMLTLAECGTEDGFEQSNVTLTFADGRASKLRIATNHWIDAERKYLTYQMTADGDPYANYFEHRTLLAWTVEGKPMSESVEEKSKLITSKDFKPGGSVGAEVKAGDGVRRRFYDSGAIAEEYPYKGGLTEGEVKTFFESGQISKTTQYSQGQADGAYREFDEKGKVRVSGVFKNGGKNGVWIRFDENGNESLRSEFKDGELITGRDRFN